MSASTVATESCHDFSLFIFTSYIHLYVRDRDRYTEEAIQLARICKALGHPARISIVLLLLEKDTCFCGDIVKEIPLAQSTVSQHLKELKEAGIIQGNITPPKVKYCINKSQWAILQKALRIFLD